MIFSTEISKSILKLKFQKEESINRRKELRNSVRYLTFKWISTIRLSPLEISPHMKSISTKSKEDSSKIHSIKLLTKR